MSHKQLSLLEPRPTWTYHRGVPDLSGMYKYTTYLRSAHDPDETMGHGKEDRDSTHWAKSKTPSVETFRESISKLMSDGEPRTFNAMCVLITGTTADVWGEKAPEQALWDLVEDETLAWTNDGDAIFFIDSSFVEWS